jgi:hypothetical protein
VLCWHGGTFLDRQFFGYLKVQWVVAALVMTLSGMPGQMEATQRRLIAAAVAVLRLYGSITDKDQDMG